MLTRKTFLQLILFFLCTICLRWGATSATVQLADNRLDHILQRLLLSLEVFRLRLLMRLHPLNGLLHCLLDGFLVLIRQLAAKLLLVTDLVLQRVGVALQLITGINPLLQLLVFISKTLCIIHHALDVLWRQAILVICDCDLIFVARAFVLSCDSQDTIDINFKRDLNLWYTTRGRRDASEVKCSQQVVVLSKRALT